MPFLAITVLVVVGGGMQPRERRSQDGGGNGGGGSGRIVVELGSVVIVCLFVVIVVSPVKMRTLESLDVSSLVVAGCRALIRDLDVLLLPSHLPPDNVAVVKRVVIVLLLVFCV